MSKTEEQLLQERTDYMLNSALRQVEAWKQRAEAAEARLRKLVQAGHELEEEMQDISRKADCAYLISTTTANRVRRELAATKQPSAVLSNTYGDFVKACPTLAACIPPHEWDNKTPSEQRDWLIENFNFYEIQEQSGKP